MTKRLHTIFGEVMNDIHSSLKLFLVINHRLCHSWDWHCKIYQSGHLQLELNENTNTGGDVCYRLYLLRNQKTGKWNKMLAAGWLFISTDVCLEFMLLL